MAERRLAAEDWLGCQRRCGRQVHCLCGYVPLRYLLLHLRRVGVEQSGAVRIAMLGWECRFYIALLIELTLGVELRFFRLQKWLLLLAQQADKVAEFIGLI